MNPNSFAHKKAPILQPKMSAQDSLRDISSAARLSDFADPAPAAMLLWPRRQFRRARGFASPDCSGFAFFGDCFLKVFVGVSSP